MEDRPVEHAHGALAPCERPRHTCSMIFSRDTSLEADLGPDLGPKVLAARRARGSRAGETIYRDSH